MDPVTVAGVQQIACEPGEPQQAGVDPGCVDAARKKHNVLEREQRQEADQEHEHIDQSTGAWIAGSGCPEDDMRRDSHGRAMSACARTK